MNESAAEIVRSARKKLQLNQKDFGDTIEKTQCSVSRYETGDIPPPSGVVMHCMNILSNSSTSNDIDELINRVSELKGSEHSKFREALNIILDGYFNTRQANH